MLSKLSRILFLLTTKSSKTTKICWRTWLSHTKLLYWSGSTSEARERVETWVKHYLGKFIHISYYFFQHLLFNDCIFYCRFLNIYKHEESDLLSFDHYFHFINKSHFYQNRYRNKLLPGDIEKIWHKKLLKIYMTLKAIAQSH